MSEFVMFLQQEYGQAVQGQAPAPAPSRGGGWRSFMGKSGGVARRGWGSYRAGQRRAQRVRNPQYAFVFGFLMDVLTIFLLGTGQYILYLGAVGFSVLVGLYVVGWPSLLYVLKVYPGGFWGYLPLFTLVSILGHVGVPVLSSSSLGGGYGSPVFVSRGGGRSSRDSSYRYGFGRYLGESSAESLAKFFGWVGRMLPLLLIVGGVIYFFTFGVPTPLKAATLTQSEVFLEKWHISERFQKALGYLNLQKALEAAAGIGDFETRPDYLIEEIQGVTVKDFQGTKVHVGVPFQLRADVVVDAFPQDTSELMFACLLKDKNATIQSGTVQISGYPQGKQTMVIPPGTKEQRFSVYCSFTGITSLEDPYKTYKAYLTWAYHNILTTTVLRVFTQQRAVQDRLMQQSLDPLKGLRGSDYVNSDGFAKDQCIKGCGLTDLSMKVGSPLPLAEEVPHSLEVGLVGLSTWRGSLQKLHELRLILREGMILDTQGCFWGGGGQLIFAQQGDHFILDENSIQLQRVNARLAKGESVDVGYTCYLRAAAGEDEQPVPVTLYAVAAYDYGGEEPASVVVVRSEEELEGFVIEV